jgi:hypothetical protein
MRFGRGRVGGNHPRTGGTTDAAERRTVAKKNGPSAVALLFGNFERRAGAHRLEFDALRKADAIVVELETVAKLGEGGHAWVPQ